MSKTKAIVKISTYEISKPDQMILAAKKIKDYVMSQRLSVPIAGHEYVMVEGWQFAGSLMGLYPVIVNVQDLGQGKWMAHAELRDKNGCVVSTGYAICTKAESKKASFDEYAILSMAQTRAIGKAFRNRIGWIIKAAGYESTPAEEAPKVKSVGIESK